MKNIDVLLFLGDLDMEKLIEKFNNEVAIKSKLANFIWQFGIIINSIICFICVIYFKQNIYII